jgi:methionine sulfoxide reductase heme-binding subunit
VIALTSPYLWYSTRATGLVALVLFTLVVALGALVATRTGGTRIGRFEVAELHRSVAAVAFVFVGIHVATTVVDSYVPTGPLSIFIPLTSAYRRVAVGVGAAAMDLMLAVWFSSLLKSRLAPSTWRLVHWFSWIGLATAIAHSFLTGTDARHGWGLALVAACALVGVASALARLVRRPPRAAGRTALSPLASAPGPGPAPPARAGAFERRPRDGRPR